MSDLSVPTSVGRFSIRPPWCAAPRLVHQSFFLALPAGVLCMGVALPAAGRSLGPPGFMAVLGLGLVGLFVPLILATQTAATLDVTRDELRISWLRSETSVPLASVRSMQRAHRRLALALRDGQTLWLLPQRFVAGGESSGWLPDEVALDALEGELRRFGVPVAPP